MAHMGGEFEFIDLHRGQNASKSTQRCSQVVRVRECAFVRLVGIMLCAKQRGKP